MLSYLRTSEDRVTRLDGPEDKCWIHLSAPTEDEIRRVLAQTQIDEGFLRAPLDEEESARIEVEGDQMLLVVDTPVVSVDPAGREYSTMPVGIILTPAAIVTACIADPPLIKDFYLGAVRGFSTKKHNRFILQLLYRNAALFLSHLRQIDKASNEVERELHKSMKNKELIAMLKLEKSLVYFSTSLRGNEAVLERLMRLPLIRQYPDDTDLLEDVIIENKQAMEMCAIHRDILSGTMDAFASVISNNLNIVMKLLTLITIILTIPSLVAGFWGMNVLVPFAEHRWGFALVVGIAVALSIAAALVMKKKKMF